MNYYGIELSGLKFRMRTPLQLSHRLLSYSDVLVSINDGKIMKVVNQEGDNLLKAVKNWPLVDISFVEDLVDLIDRQPREVASCQPGYK